MPLNCNLLDDWNTNFLGNLIYTYIKGKNEKLN
jgi:hypothetical protein